MAIVLLAASASATGAEFVVSNPNDAGPGSLRQAIVDANLVAATEDVVIRFQLPPEAPPIIRLNSPLPVIGRRLTIDALAPADSGLPGIELSGANAGPGAHGLHVRSARTTVRGLAIGQFAGHGLYLDEASDCLVEGNHLGADRSGSTARPNGGDGLRIRNGARNRIGTSRPGGGNVISGNAGHGVMLEGPATVENQLLGNFIGLDQTGLAGLGNGRDGIHVLGGSTNRLGILFEALNVIAGNQRDGVHLEGGGWNLVHGYIGPNRSRENRPGNAGNGILVTNSPGNEFLVVSVSANGRHGIHIVGAGSTNNQIVDSYVHRISLGAGNGRDGIRIEDVPGGARVYAVDVGGNGGTGVAVIRSPGTKVQRCFIGGARFNTSLFPNNQHGILVQDSADVLIGGTEVNEGNVIGQNRLHGIWLVGPETRACRVLGNWIGTNVFNGGAVASNYTGVFVNGGASDNVIGMTAPGAGNVIAFNGAGGGVLVLRDSTNNAVRGNQIYANEGLGINLSAGAVNGVDANDLGDLDAGGNGLQNFPILHAATLQAGRLLLSGSLTSRPNASFTVDLYGSDAGDPSGHGEGQRHLAEVSVATDANGVGRFLADVPAPVSPPAVLAATATDPAGNTSEFSPWLGLGGGAAATWAVTTAADAGPGSLRQALLDANGRPGRDRIVFDVPGAGPHVIAVLSPLPVVTDPVVIDGFTQPGAGGFPCDRPDWRPAIELAGHNAGPGADGLVLRTIACEIRGLAINRFSGAGLRLEGGGLHVVSGNHLGTGLVGTEPRGNVGGGLMVRDSAQNILGSQAPCVVGNVISGNGSHGIHVSGPGATGNVINGNRIGTDAAGTGALANLGDGIVMDGAPGNQIGQAGDPAFNLIGGNAGNGIRIGQSAGIRIVGTAIGTDLFGRPGLGNGGHGVLLEHSSFCVVGYSNDLEMVNPFNTIGGNRLDGIHVSGGATNLVRGNHLGTDAFARLAPPNGRSGVRLENSSRNRIVSNQICGNTAHGVHIMGAAAVGNQFDIGAIGAFLSVGSEYGNGGDGIRIEGAPETLIYGVLLAGNRGNGVHLIQAPRTTVTSLRIGNLPVPQPAPLGTIIRPVPNAGHGIRVVDSPATEITFANIIGPNGGDGIRLEGTGTRRGRIWRNEIGIDAASGVLLPNGGAGVAIVDASGNEIGVTGNTTNLIAFNAAGVTISGSAATNNAVRHNWIYANGGPGIDLGADGVTANDAGDADAGPNQLQNHPVLTDLALGPSPSAGGTLSSHPQEPFDIDVYASASLTSSGRPEARRAVGQATVMTDVLGRATFRVALSPLLAGEQFITATATDRAGNTSEFSPPISPGGELTVAVQGRGRVVRSPDQPAYATGQSVTLTAVPDRYYAFAGWGDGVGPATRTITIGARSIYTARFTNAEPLETLVFKAWERSYGGMGEEFPGALLSCADGGFLVVGSSGSEISGNKTSPWLGSTDGWLIRLDGQGQKLWERTYGGTSDDGLVRAVALPDGGYVAVGYNGEFWGDSNCWLIRVNARGDLVWEKTLGGSGADYIQEVTRTRDGGIVLAASSSSASGPGKAAPHYGGTDFWIIKLSLEGNLIWERSYGGEADDDPAAVLENPDGTLMVTGSTRSGIGPGKTTAGIGSADVWLLKLAADGSRIWERTLGGDRADYPFVIKALPEGGYLIGGDSSSRLNGDHSSTNHGSLDYWMLQVDAEGRRTADQGFGGGDVEVLGMMVAEADGGFVLGGYSLSGADGSKTVPNRGLSDAWLVGVDPAGRQRWDYSLGGTGDDFATAQPVRAPDQGWVLACSSSSPPGEHKQAPAFGAGDVWLVKLFTREAPVGAPTILVDGRYSPDNLFTVTAPAEVELRTGLVNGRIYFTLDGSPPTPDATPYTGPFTLSESATIRAMAYDAGLARAVPADAVTVVYQAGDGPRLTSLPTTDGQLQVGLPPAASGYYQIEWTSTLGDPGSWVPVGERIPADGDGLAIQLPILTQSGSGYFRVRFIAE